VTFDYMKKKTKFSKIALIAIIVVFNPINFFLIVGWQDANPEIGMNEKKVSWLPDAATNVSYYKSYSFTAYEFDISEEDFKKWAWKWDVKKIDKPVKVGRYTRRTLLMPDDPDEVEYDEYQNEVWAKIKVGYYYTTPPRGNGGGTSVAYNLFTGRAYFYSTPR